MGIGSLLTLSGLFRTDSTHYKGCPSYGLILFKGDGLGHWGKSLIVIRGKTLLHLELRHLILGWRQGARCIGNVITRIWIRGPFSNANRIPTRHEKYYLTQELCMYSKR